ncbi:N-formylglutamate amidohydrolase [Dongia sedimenti]|uniref:N-formylglutamate amidohydrolase n=1 Tax=Dongia sedimenti TaxID=3064282 RepID=A0ABU0YKZ4_9PROT|nr:N-formylglutamate amidohydrolase [Rhodospirillaceae bacterium R-7]
MASTHSKRIRFLPGVLVRSAPTGTARPLVVDSPHSGRTYPEDFGHAAPLAMLRRAEDAFVDDLYEDAPRHGAGFLKALFPRSYVDPNRHEGEIDPGMLADAWPTAIAASERTEMGLGLIRRLIRGNVPVYDRLLSVAEIEERIARFHRPYHDELEAMLAELHTRFGAVWHINAHSMKALGRKQGKAIPRDDFVLGDLEGESCDPDFTAFVVGTLRDMGYTVRINHPFKGAALVKRFGRPREGRHSLQIEVNRGLYMDEDKIEKTAGFAALKRDIDRMLAAVAEFVMTQIVSILPEAREGE